jgi:ABC-2 type transport system permease protein
MIRLVGAELRRLLARRMTLVTGIVLLVAVGLFQLAVNSEASPPSPDEVAQQRQYYQQAHDEWESNHEAALADCVAQGESQADCESAFAEPTPADFSLTATPFDQIGQVAMLLSAFLAMLAAYLVGSSFIGAEYSTGSLANWLTFVPERLKVYGSKLLAVVLAAAVAGAVVNFLMLGLAALITKAYDGPLVGGGHLAATGGRAVVMAVVAGVVGFVLALISRHTVAALGAVLGYLVVAAVLGGLAQNADGPLAWLPPWMPENNVQAFLLHGSTYTQFRETVTAEGTSGDSLERHITFGHSAVYWLVVLVVAVVGAALVFRRRDVT